MANITLKLETQSTDDTGWTTCSNIFVLHTHVTCSIPRYDLISSLLLSLYYYYYSLYGGEKREKLDFLYFQHWKIDNKDDFDFDFDFENYQTIQKNLIPTPSR